MNKTEKALSWFDNSYNCSQSVLTAFAGELGLSENEALRVACAFGGGIGRQQLTCGAVTGAAMALGLKYGKGLHNSDENKKLTYEKTVELFDEFKRMNGSVTCRKLLEDLDMTNEADYKVIVGKNLFHTNCRKYVADAVQLTEKLINNSK